MQQIPDRPDWGLHVGGVIPGILSVPLYCLLLRTGV